MKEPFHYLYDVSMSYVESGWEDRYLALVKKIDENLQAKYPEYFAGLEVYQNGPMNFVVVAVYFDVEGVENVLAEILSYVNREYKLEVGHNVRRKQILKFDRSKKRYGQHQIKDVDRMEINSRLQTEECHR